MDMLKSLDNSVSFIEFKEKCESDMTNDLVDDADIKYYCRTCAKKGSFFVPIFKGEGFSHQLHQKIEKYLPIHVTKDDVDLPLQLCYTCASVIIAWDSLVINCVEAQKKLRALKDAGEIHIILDDIKIEKPDELCTAEPDYVDSDDEPLITKRLAAIKNRRRKETNKKNVSDNSKIEDSSLLVDQERFTVDRDLMLSSQLQLDKPNQLQRELLKLGLGKSSCSKVLIALRKLGFPLATNIFNSGDKLRNCFNAGNELMNGEEIQSLSFCNRKFRKKERKNGDGIETLKASRCEDCGKTLSSSVSLRNHKKIHSSEPTMTCHICGKVFRHRFSLVRHLKVIHEGVRKYCCSDCGKRYRSQGEMRDHVNVHQNGQKIVCEECGKIFLTKSSFYPHIKSHRSKKLKPQKCFPCEICRKSFTTKKSKNQHTLIHTGEKPIVCGICDKSFRTKANYSQHKRIHSGIKPFACEHCGKRFGRKDHLTIHVRCHTGEKPFPCNFCGRAFAQMSDMKKHGRLHEKNDDRMNYKI